MIFIDTGAFIARYIVADQHHHEAVPAWERLGKEFRQAYTSNFVIDETLTLLARRTDYDYAQQKGIIIYSSTFLSILRPEHDDEMKALELMKKYADQEVSFTDCVSFVLMKKHKIARVFAYDRHFLDAGFTLWN